MGMVSETKQNDAKKPAAYTAKTGAALKVRHQIQVHSTERSDGASRKKKNAATRTGRWGHKERSTLCPRKKKKKKKLASL